MATDDEQLVQGGQGRSEQEVSDAASNGRVAFVGGILVIVAAVIWILLLSGCANPARQVFPNESVKKGMNAL